MEGLENLLLLFGVAGCLPALLVHAILTLSGMREKWIYPLLRVKTPDGSVSPVVRVRPDRHRAAATMLACAV